MKEILDEASKQALITYRIQRAYETLNIAAIMMTLHIVMKRW